jgi:hypothetical protein
MNPKSFLGFLAVTVVIVVAAAVSISARYSAAVSVDLNEVVYPGFADKFGDVAEIQVQDKDKTLTVKRDGKGWVLSDRSNYLADGDVVRQVLVGLTELRLREAKTEKKELFSKLSVEDVTEKDSKSGLLTIKDKGGKVLASLIVGKENSDLAGGADVGRYIRKPNEKQAWLAEGRLVVPGAVKAWVSPKILDVSNKRIDTVVVTQPNGLVMDVKREKIDGEKFVINNMPEGRKIEYQSDIDNMGDGLDKLELEEVRAAGKIEFPADKTISTTLKTFDGLMIDVKLLEKGDDFWATFVASAGDGAEDKVKKEAEDINATVSRWVYAIPAHKYRYMTRKVEDVLEQPKKEEEKKN